jgi:hypothetical protein
MINTRCRKLKSTTLGWTPFVNILNKVS